jgi:cytochrome c peroxidase
MSRTGRCCTVALGCLLALGACSDGPTSLAPDGPEFNRGQTKKRAAEDQPTGTIVELGKEIFEDINLSVRGNQSCQTCHEPSEGFAAALSSVRTRGSVVEGSVSGRFGARKPPSAAYASLAPVFSGGNNPTGGNFWDGRATGEVLGSPTADQALGPFLDRAEQALPDRACVVYGVLKSNYASRYTELWGAPGIAFPSDIETICANTELTAPDPVALSPADRARVEEAYHNIARALAAYQGSDYVNRFNSRFDYGELEGIEPAGEKLFSSKGKCQQCHDNRGDNAVFTDFKYHNLGVPKNPANPVYDTFPGFVDLGLGGFTGQARHEGKFRTPTTRNVGKGQNRTFMHNGALVSLIQVVDFYNTRDVLRECTDEEFREPARWGSTDFGGFGCWPPPEIGQNLDTKNMGKLGLTPDEVRAIVAYLEAMSDR